jgi:hypothetical protein
MIEASGGLGLVSGYDVSTDLLSVYEWWACSSMCIWLQTLHHLISNYIALVWEIALSLIVCGGIRVSSVI